MDDRKVCEACEELASWMDDAAEDVGSWGAYASSYFQEKWDLDSDVARFTQRAEAIRSSCRHPAPGQVAVPWNRLPRLIELCGAACRKAAVECNERDYEVFSAIRGELNEAMLTAAPSAQETATPEARDE